MHATTLAAPAREVDSRAAYASFAWAYVLGHGTAALSKGTDPVLALPSWLPLVILGAGLIAGTVHSVNAANRAQRGASKPELFSAKLLAISWGIGFGALFLAVFGLSSTIDVPGLQDVLLPAGSTIVVGLLYLAEGAVRRNTLHYSLGSGLALIGGVSLFFSVPGLFWVLAVAGGGAYTVAAVLERRRLNV